MEVQAESFHKSFSRQYDQYVADYQSLVARTFGEDPQRSKKRCVVLVDGSLETAVQLCLLGEVMQRYPVALMCPHLSVDHRDAAYALCEKFASETLMIPITMVLVDLTNQITHAGLKFPSAQWIRSSIKTAQQMVVDAVREQDGYVIAPPMPNLSDVFDDNVTLSDVARWVGIDPGQFGA